MLSARPARRIEKYVAEEISRKPFRRNLLRNNRQLQRTGAAGDRYSDRLLYVAMVLQFPIDAH